MSIAAISLEKITAATKQTQIALSSERSANMKIHRHFVNNPLRNFNYLLACPFTREAMAIDPLDYQAIMNLLKQHDYQLVGIINTHEHADHTNGNLPLLEYQHVPVYAHYHSINIPGYSNPVSATDHIQFGQQQLRVLDTPGHTDNHICLYHSGNEAQPPAFFSGDTLFNAGVGNCHSGDVNQLFDSIQQIKQGLDDTTELYPGHDYLENNCRFSLTCEPGNITAARLLEDITNQKLVSHQTTQTFAIEKQINCFFRLDNSEIREKLAEEDLISDVKANGKEVFVALRRLRDQW